MFGWSFEKVESVVRDYSQWFQVQRWKVLSSALGFERLGAGIKIRVIYK